MAPPVRRACYSCIKAKRKCNLASPRCDRCVQRRLVCDYDGTSTGERQSPIASTELDGATTVNLDEFDQNQFDLFDLNDQTIGDGGDGLSMDTDPQVLHQLSSDTNIDGITTQLQPTSNSSIGLEWPRFDLPIPKPLWRDHLDVVKVATFGPEDDYQLSGDIYRPRVNFASRLIQQMPRTFVDTGQAPFIHRQLCHVHESATMLDALSACALYTARTALTTPLVFRDIARKARALVGREHHFSSALDLLVGVQALALYQIMRLFDGDIRLRAAAEADMPTFEAWTQHLLQHTPQIEPETFEQDLWLVRHKSTVSCWNSWLYGESARRTALVSLLIQGVYSFLKNGYDGVSCKIYKLSLTAQTALWTAPSHFHWKHAMVEGARFQVRLGDWDNTMTDATPDDLDELGILLLGTMKDVDFTASWLGKDHVARYRLDWDSLQQYQL